MSAAIIAPLLLYFLAPLTVAALGYRRISRSFPTALTFITAMMFQQLLFALIASVIESYAVAAPLAALLTVVAGAIGTRRGGRAGEERDPSPLSQFIPWLLMGATFALYLSLRMRYPSLEFFNTPDDVGVEKMFNLSLQQSFLFGRDYPPEWIWLGGEQIRYYTFLKSIPGIWSWLARVLLSDPATGGVFFLLSEAFFIALIPAVVSGWILWFARAAGPLGAHPRSVQFFSIFTALFLLVGTHYRAFSMGLRALFDPSAPRDWWQLSRLVPYTDNQYIGWLLMLGDNHAYSQVYFLQLLFWGAFVSLLLVETRRPALSAVCGVLAATILLSHPASVLIDLSSLALVTVAIVAIVMRKGEKGSLASRLVNLGVTVITALFFALFLYEPSGQVKVVFPETRLLSRSLDFAMLNLSPLLFLAILFLALFARRESLLNFCRTIALQEWLWVSAIILATTMYLLDRPALAIMVVSASFVFTLFMGRTLSDRQSLLALVAAGSFFIWLIPEIVAFDHKLDNRTDWIRFQMSLRFWPEAFLLIPFSLALASLERVKERGIHWTVMLLGVVIIVAFSASHAPGIQNRAARARQTSSLDAFERFVLRFPSDAAIVSFLRAQPASERLVIAEGCGFGSADIPVDYSWSGRISAFSGRTGVCGWARHALLFNDPLRGAGFAGSSVLEKLTTYQTSYRGLLEAVYENNSEKLAMHRTALRSFGVTHFVFGEQERRLFGGITVRSIGAALQKGPLIENGDGTGIISLL